MVSLDPGGAIGVVASPAGKREGKEGNRRDGIERREVFLGVRWERQQLRPIDRLDRSYLDVKVFEGLVARGHGLQR